MTTLSFETWTLGHKTFRGRRIVKCPACRRLGEFLDGAVVTVTHAVRVEKTGRVVATDRCALWTENTRKAA